MHENEIPSHQRQHLPELNYSFAISCDCNITNVNVRAKYASSGSLTRLKTLPKYAQVLLHSDIS